jgi:predicted O-methyltransferase YrrM
VTYPNWFKQIAQHNFEQFLLPLAGKDDLKFLQLGVFTGDASVWMAQNILTGKGSYLTDVDTWEGAANEPIQEQMDFDDVYATYSSKVKDLPVTPVTMRSDEYLLRVRSVFLESYDFIYVDAHHTSASAFLDSELSWPLLKPQGILAIDDYEWLHPDGVDIHAPKIGIHMFLDRHKGEYEELICNQQLWIRKK